MPKPDFEACLANMQPFTYTSVNAFPGQITIPAPQDIGILPRDWEDRYRADCDRKDARIAYIVLHHGTPLAWVLLDELDLPVEVVIPDVWYSRTSSTWQNRCKKWLPFPNHRVTQL